MGTRADFYVGRGESAEWLGSIAFDGYPQGIADDVLHASDEATYRRNVASFLADCRHATLPDEGWPWPWEDSRTTDYAYAFDGDRVWAACFGYAWRDMPAWLAMSDDDRDAADAAEDQHGKACVFPQMDRSRAKAPGSRGSGLMMVSFGPAGIRVQNEEAP